MTSTCENCGETTRIHQDICMWCGKPWGGQAKKPPLIGGGVERFMKALAGLLLLFAILEASIVLAGPARGMDYDIYHSRSMSWLAGEGFYLPYQLAGPYEVGLVSPPPAVYPPPMAVLGLLPPLLWWGIPLVVIAAALWRARPAPWTWVVLAAILVYPRTWLILSYGNPSMWAFAALVAGLVWTWPAPFTALKLTLAPFALVPARRPAFWAGVLASLALALPFGLMWGHWAIAMLNARNGFGLEYLFGEWPIALALLWASAGFRLREAKPVEQRVVGRVERGVGVHETAR